MVKGRGERGNERKKGSRYTRAQTGGGCVKGRNGLGGNFCLFWARVEKKKI
jgi:hypothetical protein